MTTVELERKNTLISNLDDLFESVHWGYVLVETTMDHSSPKIGVRYALSSLSRSLYAKSLALKGLLMKCRLCSNTPLLTMLSWV